MNITEDRLRAALLETAEEVPSGAVPPLELPAEIPGSLRGSGHRPSRQPRRLPAALAAAAAVCLIITLPLTLTGGPGQVASTRLLAQFPSYYVALQRSGCDFWSPCNGDYSTDPDRAVVASTLTGSTLTTVTPPKPYGTFAFVQGTANDHDFVLGAQRLTDDKPGNYPATRLYLLRLNPSARPGHQALLTALPVPLLPGMRGYELCWIALSPDGHRLAAISTTTATNNPTQLRVFNLVTGTSRTWLLPSWAERGDTYSDVAGPPSWSADSRTLAFFDRTSTRTAEVVLLDTSAGAASFTADSRFVKLPELPRTEEFSFLPDSPLLTPDGKHVLEEVINLREANARSRPFDPFALDVVNLDTGAVRQLRAHSQIFYTEASDASGRAVIVAIGSVPPGAASFVAWTPQGTTPIQVPAGTIGIAW
jgi:hypothetical protein